MKNLLCLVLCVSAALFMPGCGKQQTDVAKTETEGARVSMVLYINDTKVPVMWEDNAAVSKLMQDAAQGDITVSMSMYGGFEQVGPLGKSYPGSDAQLTTANGDIVLYNSSNIVVFYGSNSWAYTRLGHMELPADEVTGLLANGSVTLRIVAGNK